MASSANNKQIGRFPATRRFGGVILCRPRPAAGLPATLQSLFESPDREEPHCQAIYTLDLSRINPTTLHLLPALRSWQRQAILTSLELANSCPHLPRSRPGDAPFSVIRGGLAAHEGGTIAERSGGGCDFARRVSETRTRHICRNNCEERRVGTYAVGLMTILWPIGNDVLEAG